MLIITHTLLPLVFASVDNKSLDKRGQKYWIRTRLALLALAGALPDLINPHISIYARYRSYSHSVSALILAFIIFMAFFGLYKKDHKLALSATVAYGLHLFCDYIAGGLAWNYPFSRAIIGDYYIPFKYWIHSDFACVLFVYLFYRAIPNIAKAKKKSHSS